MSRLSSNLRALFAGKVLEGGPWPSEEAAEGEGEGCSWVCIATGEFGVDAGARRMSLRDFRIP